MIRAAAILLFSLFCFGAQSMEPSLSVLAIGYRTISTDGRIDPRVWENQDHRFNGPFSIRNGKERQEFLQIGELFYKINSKAQLDGSARRYMRYNARQDIEISNHHILYRGRMLKYPGHVRNDRSWGLTDRDDPPQCFRFGDYIVFLVQARLYFRKNPWDFVAYNLKDDTYSIYQTIGTWPYILMFNESEGVPDPRLQNEVQ